MTKESIAKTFTISGTFHQTGDINDSQVSWDPYGLVKITKPIKAIIRHSYTTFFWINGAEREIFGTSSRISDTIEKGGFSNIWQPHDTHLKVVAWTAKERLGWFRDVLLGWHTTLG